MGSTLIHNATIVNEGQVIEGDLLIKDGLIDKIGKQISAQADTEIEAGGKHLIPGVIDDQVHFREPGLTHKASIETEARAAVAGGTTSFMEMPNTKPPALTQEALEEKYRIAARSSLANYSFYMGTSNNNLEEVLKTDGTKVCGIKIFMGSSTGNMLVDDQKTLEDLFSGTPLLIATHCEDETRILSRFAEFQEKYGSNIPIEMHAMIRDEEACYLSSSYAVDLAKKHNTKLHVFHISTEEELSLFDSETPLKDKRITSEICVHHLYFDASDYTRLGSQIKCNPAIKEKRHKEALLKGLLDNKLDVIATDHAPHTWEEKQNEYAGAPSGLPLIQHGLNIMLEFVERLSLERVVEKMCHAPAELFRIQNRGYIREGYAADLVIVDLNDPWVVSKENIYYRCGWSPLEGKKFNSRVTHTFVNGHLAYTLENGFDESAKGQRLMFKI